MDRNNLGHLGFPSNRKFILNVQQIPMLWDMKCPDYRLQRLVKSFEWERIGEEFKLSGAQALQQWIYFKEKYKREISKPDSRWPLLNCLRFLDSNPRRTRQNDGYMEKDIEQAIQKFDIVTARAKPNSNNSTNTTQQQSNKKPYLHNHQVQKLNVHQNSDTITPIIMSIATTNNKITKTEDKLSPLSAENIWPPDDEVMDNDNGFMSDDSLIPQSDYKNRCRAFAKYLGEELCLMDECTGDALITDMLKIIVEEKCKK